MKPRAVVVESDKLNAVFVGLAVGVIAYYILIKFKSDLS